MCRRKEHKEKTVSIRKIVKLVVFGVVGLLGFITLFSGFYVINPGERGVVVTLGQVAGNASKEGLGFKTPLISYVERVQVKQETWDVHAEAFSSDLQQVRIDLNVLYRIPEESVIAVVQKYAGNPFLSLVNPRIQEAIKEVTALETAVGIAQNREAVKTRALDLARKKVGDFLVIQDLVINNITLSKELEQAIEQKMVQQQEAAKAAFTKQKAEMDAQTAVVRAEGESKALAARAQGEAQAIKIRGDALKQNPNVIELMIAEKWNGVSPLVVGSGQGSNIILPLPERKQ
jgi:prohibitin 2